MLSSGLDDRATARCGKVRKVGYFMKPVSEPDLLDAILSAIGGNSEQQALTVTPLTVAAGGKLRILLAEDNLVNRIVAAAIIRQNGHTLAHAINGREAVEASSKEAFDLIFMDVQMPEMDGFEATARIRESERRTGQHTPIVAMTAHAMVGDRERCLASGMDDYMCKPLKRAEVFAFLERISAGLTPLRGESRWL
jgi:two-component system, sensor histidine kinase and response regulator